MPNNIDLSIVLVNYKMDGLLRNCLKSIFEHDHKRTIEVIVVDNGSADDCEEIVTNEFPQATFIQTGANLGYSKGNNVGIKQANGKYILTLNPDTVMLKPIIDDWLDFMDEKDDIGICTVQLRNPDNSIQEGAWRFYKFLTPAYQRLGFLRRTEKGQKHIHHFTMSEWDRNESRYVDWVQGSCLLMRRDTMKEIGHKDEGFFLYLSEVDWCRRAWEAGWRVYYHADLSLVHYYRRQSADKLGLSSLFNKTTRIHIKDWMYFLKKYKDKLHYHPADEFNKLD